jgi:hypothetical protein
VRAALDGQTDNDALLHWTFLGQTRDPETGVVTLRSRTRQSGHRRRHCHVV